MKNNKKGKLSYDEDKISVLTLGTKAEAQV